VEDHPLRWGAATEGIEVAGSKSPLIFDNIRLAGKMAAAAIHVPIREEQFSWMTCPLEQADAFRGKSSTD
jgi:hypothetical protein